MFTICDFCKKTYKIFPSQYKRYKHHFCSNKCKGLNNKGKAWGGAISTAGKKLGPYNKNRVHNMAQAKKKAFIAKALKQPAILNLKKVREVLKHCYCTTDSGFTNIMEYPKGFKWAAAARYILAQEGLQYKPYVVAEPIRVMNLIQIQWFENLLQSVEDYYDFRFNF